MRPGRSQARFAQTVDPVELSSGKHQLDQLADSAIPAAYLVVRQSGIFDPLIARAVVQGAAPGTAGPKTVPTVGGRGGTVKLLFMLPQSN